MKDTKKQQLISDYSKHLVENIDNIDDLRWAFTCLDMELEKRASNLNTDRDGMANKDFSVRDYNLFTIARKCLGIAIDLIIQVKN